MNITDTTQKIFLDAGVNLQSRLLSAFLLPEDAIRGVIWKSSSPDIAKVNANGLVTALKAGTETISVTTVDGSKKSAKIKVKVARLFN